MTSYLLKSFTNDSLACGQCACLELGRMGFNSRDKPLFQKLVLTLRITSYSYIHLCLNGTWVQYLPCVGQVGVQLLRSTSFSKISTSLNTYFMFTKRIYICPSGTWVKCLPLVKQDWVQFQGPTSLFLRLVLDQRMTSCLPKRFTYVPVAQWVEARILLGEATNQYPGSIPGDDMQKKEKTSGLCSFLCLACHVTARIVMLMSRR